VSRIDFGLLGQYDQFAQGEHQLMHISARQVGTADRFLEERIAREEDILLR
jgi:hypothetical protein